MSTFTQARLHEHAGRVAMSFTNEIGESLGQTVYITTELAAKLAKGLDFAAQQISNGYHFPTTGINREP